MAKVLQITTIPSPALGGTRVVLNVLPIFTNKELVDDPVARLRPRDVIEITVAGKVAYANEDPESWK